MSWPLRVAIGSHCILERNIYFKHDGMYGGVKSILIGDYVFIGTSCEFNIRAQIRIENHTLIGSGCQFIDHDHGVSRDVPMAKQPGIEAPILIGEDV